MSTRVDSLRNTLDHLALDTRASEDRRYLVSMLRRLGYSDAEIEAEMGSPVSTGSEARVIEVEYEGPVAGTPRSAAGRETTFQVAQPGDDGLTFRLSGDDGPAGAGIEEVHAADLSGVESDLGDWGDDFEQGERDDFTSVEGDAPDDFGPSSTEDGAFTFNDGEDEDEELVEFRAVERPDVAVAAGWHEAGDAEAAGWTEDTTPEWNPEATDDQAASAWDTAANATHEETDAWNTPADDSAWDTAPAASEWDTAEETSAWTEAETVEETAWPEAEPDANLDEQAAWAETELPEATQASEEAEEWVDADAPGTTAPTTTEPWPEPEAMPEPEPAATEAYHHGDYALYTREVQLSTGRKQRIFFFAKNEPQSGDPCPLPDGYEVIENEKTGLPFLRRQR